MSEHIYQNIQNKDLNSIVQQIINHEVLKNFNLQSVLEKNQELKISFEQDLSADDILYLDEIVENGMESDKLISDYKGIYHWYSSTTKVEASRNGKFVVRDVIYIDPNFVGDIMLLFSAKVAVSDRGTVALIKKNLTTGHKECLNFIRVTNDGYYWKKYQSVCGFAVDTINDISEEIVYTLSFKTDWFGTIWIKDSQLLGVRL